MATRRKVRDERKGESIRIRLTAAEKGAWTAAAEHDGRDLSGWLRFLANRELQSAEPAKRLALRK